MPYSRHIMSTKYPPTGLITVTHALLTITRAQYEETLTSVSEVSSCSGAGHLQTHGDMD